MSDDTTTTADDAFAGHADEPHAASQARRLNALRAAVLGANDGIVSLAGMVVGVAGASSDKQAVLVAGVAGLVAGAVSMSLGEYVSVSSQRDSERGLVEKERRELAEQPEAEFDELVGLYEQKGLSRATATAVATELTRADALRAHLDIELGIDPDELVSPGTAAMSSAAAFLLGGIVPVMTMAFAPAAVAVWVTVAVVLVALGVTGWLGARFGGAPPLPATLRVMVGGGLGLALTYGVGTVFGAALG